MKTVRAVFLAVLMSLAATQAFAFLDMFSGPKDVQAENGVVRIPASEVSDGKVHHFRFAGDGPELKFFLIESGDRLRAAFDACDVCYHAKKGYTQDKEFVICNNCGMRFHASRIGDVKGGCNPAPLAHRVEGGDIVISVADLAAGAEFFK
ncbi:Fe-S-containing protein [Desulfomicrobium salsuginis]